MYNKLKTEYIKDYNTTLIDFNFIVSLLRYVAEVCPFSTFGYIKGYNSDECLDKTNSGNCVALSLYIKRILNYYNIKSFLIPASVPKMFSHEKYLEISHVALCIPYESYAYILDPAFYFMEPMIVDLSNRQKIGIINSFNIYSNKVTPINYKVNLNFKKIELNSYQTIPKDIFIIESSFVSDPTDIWYYYLTEILNPDEAISSFYISIKQLPFITVLNSDYSIKYLVKFIDDKTIIIKENGDLIFEGDPKNMSLNMLKKLAPYKLDFFLPRHIGYLDFNIL